jgi:hypothetical protein
VERVEGIVSDIRHGLFKVDDRFVKVISGQPPVVSEGDMMAVAGYSRRGFIIPYACHNTSKKIMWHQSFIHYLLAGILVIVCGIFVLTGASEWLIALGCVVSIIGIVMIAKGIVIFRAIRYVSTPQT